MDGGLTLQRLSDQECHAYLSQNRLGRLAVTANALPAIRSVWFAVTSDHLVIRCPPVSGLRRAANSVVAFQTDHTREDGTGWSVHLLGVCRLENDPTRLNQLRQLPLSPWSEPPEQDVFLRLPLAGLTGDRILKNGAFRGFA